MAKSKRTASKPDRLEAARADAEVERLLDSVDDALVSGDRGRVSTLVEQLWRVRKRAPEVLTRRLVEGRAAVPRFAFYLLGGLAGPRAGTYLRRIADDRSVSDIVRFGARRRAGWPERGEAKRRAAFLASLQDPDGTLVLALDQASDTWPPSSDILQEVLGHLIALPPERRRTIVERSVRELGARVGWLLRALLHVSDPATQRLALAELVRLREVGAVGAIDRLAKTAGDAQLRSDAAAAAQRLRLQVVGRGEPAEPRPLPPLERALLSIIDGSGGQVVLVVRQLGGGAFLMADVFHAEDWGIKGTFGSSFATTQDLEGILDGFEEQEIQFVEVDTAAIRGVLAEAATVNAASGRPIPPEFELWEPFAHESDPPSPSEAVTALELDDAPYARRQDLVRAGGRLADHPFFLSWGFDAARMSAAMIVAPPPSGMRLTDRQYRPMIEQLVDPPTRDRLRRRLRRQAWLLEQAGDTAARDWALATAAQLADAAPAELARQPFLRGLVRRSLIQLVATTLLPNLAGSLALEDPWE